MHDQLKARLFGLAVTFAALAVFITVPGPLTPGLQIGAVTQRPVADKTTIAVGVANTGNVRLTHSARR